MWMEEGNMKHLLPIAALLGAIAQPSAAEVIASDETGFVVRHTAEVPADPAQTWQMLVAPNKWWDKAHTFSGDSANLYLDAQGGGCFCEKLPPKQECPARAGAAWRTCGSSMPIPARRCGWRGRWVRCNRRLSPER